VIARKIVLAKHAQPLLDPLKPARDWLLADEGEAQALRLATALQPFAPFRLVTSPEPKAYRTCEIVAEKLRVPMTPVSGLKEIDRPVLPIVPAAEHERLNARIFANLDQKVIGEESGREALDRFTTAVLGELRAAKEQNLVAVGHGTVISLFVGEHNGIEAFALWKRLRCPSFVVLDGVSLRLIDEVDEVV
jgi:probable phosphoglycerate mutase